MDRQDPAVEVARELASLWSLHRTNEFARYLEDAYGHGPESCPRFDRILVAEALTGDVASGVIGSVIRRWWVIDDLGFREVDVQSLDFTERAGFYLAPIRKFFMERDRVAIGERLGPAIGWRMVGRYLSDKVSSCLVDLKTVWISASKGVSDSP